MHYLLTKKDEEPLKLFVFFDKYRIFEYPLVSPFGGEIRI